MHVIDNKSLCISPVMKYSIGIDISAVGSNKLLGIRTAKIMWLDKDSKKNQVILEDALCYPDSPTNAIIATKLGLDADDNKLNAQTFFI